MTGTDLGGRTAENRGGRNKPTSSEKSIRNRGCAVIKQLSSNPQIINSPGRSKTRQETVVVTLTWSTSFSSSKINQTTERRGKPRNPREVSVNGKDSRGERCHASNER